MKKRLLSVAFLVSAWGSYGQVGIGTLSPNNSSQLDVVATDKGILIPRVALQSTLDTTTITNGNVNSLLVFNTNTQNDITPGYYYWYTDRWMRIINDSDLAELDTNTTNTSLTVLEGELVLTDSDGNTVSIPVSDLNIPSTLINNEDGTYTYTNEMGDTVTINVPSDVINNFEQIINNNEVLNQLIENLTNTTVGGNVYYDGDTFTYVDEAGDSHVINFEEIVQANETVTTLEVLGEGQYLYTSEDGTETTINVAQDVIENFETIVNESNTEVIEQLITVLGDTYVGGNVYYDGDTFTYVDEAGDSHVINFEEIVQANETVTTLEVLGEGQYLYTSEDGTETTINVAQDVIENFETIVNESNTEVIEQLITVLGDTYVGGNVYYDGDTFTYVDENGDSHVINFEEIVQANETVTTLEVLGEGQYLYTSEDGTETTINVAQDVIENFETIVNESNTEVIEQLITVLGDTYVGGNVYYDGDTFTYVDEAGDSHVINFEEIVQANETVTTLEVLGEGQYLYTSEDGTETTINVAQDVIENFETIVNESNTEVIEQLITVLGDTYVGGNVYYDGDTFTYVDEAGDSHVINFEEIVQANETVTTLEVLGEGRYLYTSEDGTETTINVAQDVIENFETIVNESNTEVIEQLITVLGDTYVGGNVYYDGDTFTYVDEAGDSHVINFEEIVQANETVTTLEVLGEGQYLYTSEDGTETTINVAQDVIENFETIVNESNTEVIEQLITVLGDTYVGGNVYYDGDTFTYVDEAGDSHVINFEEIVQANETVTTLEVLGEGQYLYTSEDGTETRINVAQDVIENFETIVNESNTEVIEQLITVLGDTYVGGNVYYDGDTFTYVDEAGDSHVINFEEIVQANETVTTLEVLGEGQYLYTSEDGTETTINVAQDVIENFETIVNESNTEVIEQLITVLGDTYVGGNVYYDGDTFTYVDEAGDSHVINFEEIVQANETVTTLEVLGEGQYLYTSEDGTETTINVAQDVIENFETIVNESNTEVIEQLITVLGDTYVGGNVYYDGDTFTYVDEAGDSHVINFEEIVQANETVTTLEVLGEGRYLYTSEDGTETTINVVQDVIENFETIVNESNTEVIEQLITVLGDTYVGGNVYYDGDTFTYVDENGDSHVINFEEIVQANETVTTLEVLGEGQYLYTSEDGTETTINVAQDVIENFETIVNESNTEVIEQLITVLGDTYVGGNVYYDGDTFTYVDENGDSHVINFEEIVQANETVTTLEVLGEGQYLYTSEDGTETTINVAQDVIENFETIVNESNTEVIEQLITVLGDTYVGGNVYYDGDTFTYVDEAGDSHVINFEEIVQANETVTTLEVLGEGRYLYTSEDGTETTINVAQDVIENFETIVNESNTEVIEQLITVLGDTYVGGNVYYDGDTFTYVDENGDSHVINFEEIVQANETVTTLEVLGEGQYLYTSEDGTETTINVAQDVIENFETIVNESNTEVIEQLITVLGDTYVGGNVYYDGDTFTYVDENGDSHVINFEEIVQANETVTTLEVLGEGQYLYTSEDGTETTINVAQDVIENFETIVNESNTEVIEQLITVLGDTYVGGNVYYDGDTFTYVDENGDSHVINFEEIVQAYDTNTTNESFTIEGEELVITDTDGGTVRVALEELATAIDTNTEISTFEIEGSNIVLRDDNGGEWTIALSEVAAIVDTNTTNESFTIEGEELVITDTDGGTVRVALEELATAIDTNTEISTFEIEGSNIVLRDDNGGEWTIALSEVAAIVDTNTTNESFTIEGEELVITDTDGGTVRVALEDLAAAIDTNTEISNFVIVGEDIVLTDDNGGEWTIALSDLAEHIDTDTKIQSFAIDNDYIVLKDDNEGVWSISLEDLQSYIDTDTDTRNLEFTIEGGDLVLTDTEGGTVRIALSAISSKSVVTPLVTTGNTIATHDDGDGTTVDIKETITKMEQDDVTGIITYTDEDGEESTAMVVSEDAGNQIKVGTDGGAFYQKVNSIVSTDVNYTVADGDETILIDATGGKTITIPPAADNKGRILTIRKTDHTYGVLTFSQAINHSSGVTFNTTNMSGTITIQSDGTNWYMIN